RTAPHLPRRLALPFLAVPGTVLLLSLVEVYQLALYSFIGAVSSGELGRAVPAWVYLLLLAYGIAHLWFFSRPRRGRLGSLAVFESFRRARVWPYLVLPRLNAPNPPAA